MYYLGGKGGREKIGRQIGQLLESVRPQGALFVDVCCGALNVTRHLSNPRIAIDVCAPLVTTLQAAIDGWRAPEFVTREYYDWYRRYRPAGDPMTGFLQFGGSFGGKSWGGYAMGGGRGRGSANSLHKKAKDCQGAKVFCLSFQDVPLLPRGTVLYCDPPYVGTTPYGATQPFPHLEFWMWAERQARNGVSVYISEGIDWTPPGWYSVRDWWIRSSLAADDNSSWRLERLFTWVGR